MTLLTTNPIEHSSAKPPAVSPYVPLLKVAWLAGLVGLAVCLLMLVGHLRTRAEDPLRSPQLRVLKEQLLAEPKNEPLKEQIRALDLELRRRYFRQVFLNRSGAWLALGAFTLALVAGKRAMQDRRRLPMPQPNPTAAEQMARAAAWSRWSVGALALLVGIGLLWAGLSTRAMLPRDLSGLDKLLNPSAGGAPLAATFATPEEMQRNWPQFRGPGGQGFSSATNVPLAWAENSGARVVWKSEVPVAGFNSPIVWGERVFVSGGDATKREVLCYGSRGGELLWRRTVDKAPGPPGESAEIPEHTGYAASTMATDGRRVYAIFATGDLVAFTLDGKQVWAKNLGIPRNPHGHASSLVTWQGRLIVQMDQGDAEDNVSKLLAFEGATGRVAWQRNRPVSVSWATPLVVEAAGKTQIITFAVPWVMAYNAVDGTELWRVEGLNGEVTASPAFAAEMVLAFSPHEKIMAIRPDGQGDISNTHVAWFAEDDMPDITSPAANGELVFTLTTPGLLACYEAKDGAKHWEQELGIACHASPTVVGDRLYLIGTKGTVVVTQAGRTFQELGRSEMGEGVHASPAFVDGRIFIRGEKHLFGIAIEEQLARSE